jgi:hypothetical protein
MPPSGRFLGHKSQKVSPVFPLALINDWWFPADFFVKTRIQLGCVLLFFWKLSSEYFRRNKILKAFSKNVFYPNYEFSKGCQNWARPQLIEKKVHTPICPKYFQKIFSQIGLTVSKKKGKPRYFSSKIDFQKNAKESKVVFFHFVSFLSCWFWTTVG